MAYCYPCDRRFPTYKGYQNHINTSARHATKDWECEFCDREFVSEHSRHQHYSTASDHPYCIACRRLFKSDHNLMQHMHSQTHVGSKMECPFCTGSFATASGVTIHLESGNCPSGVNRQQVNEAIRNLDRNNVVTKRMITLPGYGNGQTTMATERSWNGDAYECYICEREFGTLKGLNQHLASPVHEQKIYHCPKRSCGSEFKLLSGLIAHFESESCGLFRFEQVQRKARNGVQNMIGRMIGN